MAVRRLSDLTAQQRRLLLTDFNILQVGVFSLQVGLIFL